MGANGAAAGICGDWSTASVSRRASKLGKRWRLFIASFVTISDIICVCTN